MWIDPAGWPFVVPALLVAIAGWWWSGMTMALPGLALAVLFLFFFRDPERRVAAASEHSVLSPADGRVMAVGPAPSSISPAGQWQHVSIFLSPMDVHVNRVPISGTITDVRYHPGRFLPAYRAESGHLNEYTELWVDHQGQAVVFRQIVGVLARRVVCRARQGDRVTTGQRFGVMKFGSRMDVFLPMSATVLVTPDDRVVGGITEIARLAEPQP